MGDVKVCYKALDELKPYENNPRDNTEAIEPVARSIEEFGFKVPMVVAGDGTIVTGHTRYEAAKLLELDSVPCIVADDLTDEQIKAFRIIDNRVAEIADWDEELLELEIKGMEFDWGEYGFDDMELGDMGFDDTDEAEDDFDVDAAMDEIEEPRTKLGQIIQLGEHYLMCGDSTSADDVSRLMAAGDGAVADMVLTDPPYNIDYEGGNGLKIENDNMSDAEFVKFLTASFKRMSEHLKAGGAFYIFHADSKGYEFRQALINAGLQLRQNLIWVKNSFTLGRQDYQWKHEPCLYGWKDGAAHYFVDDRTQSTVIEDKVNTAKLSKAELKELCDKLLADAFATTTIDCDKPKANDEHPTMKPILLCAQLVKNSTKPSEVVLDLFGGSGSTLITCQQTGRSCRTMELDPKYCDVIVSRWESLTGEQAVVLDA